MASSLIEPPSEGPRILVYDIETSPALGWVWGKWDQNVLAFEQDWSIMCFAYKWLGQDEIGFERVKRVPNDKALTKKLHRLFDQADVVISHNGKRFDQRRAQARFLKHGLGPASPFQEIDTLRESRTYFGDLSHKLDDIGRRHDLGKKVGHQGFTLWLDCMNGDESAWATMEEYNRQDVALLEKVYLMLRPYIGTPGRTAHPNMGHWRKGDSTCPKCGSTDLVRRGFHRTSVSEFQTLHCKDCGGYSRARKRESQRVDGGPSAV